MWFYIFFLVAAYAFFKFLRYTGKPQPVTGAVFVTGCDSGMGENTAFHLSKTGYYVFAGCYLKESFKKYEGNDKITPILIDVSKEDNVKEAAQQVEKVMEEKKLNGLFGILQCAGIAYTAPFEYIPMTAIKNQMEVNFFGYIYVARAFLPLLKKSVMKPGARRGRICFVSSGPLPGPGVPFVTSYLAAKWGGEAVIQGLRMEFAMAKVPIDCCVLSPGIVKPTALAAEGKKLLDKTFEQMPKEATDEYKEMVECFRQYQFEMPGTHVSVVGKQMERIMNDGKPHLRYFVGIDAMCSTIVGVLPTFMREFLMRNTLMGKYDKVSRFTY